MKTKFTFIFLSLFLITCGKKSDELSSKMIHGVWVPKIYVDKIVESKSPFAASDSLSRISALIIDSNEVQRKDSLIAGVSWGNHVGGNITIFLKRGLTDHSFMTDIIDYNSRSNHYEIEYSMTQNDTVLNILHYDKGAKLLNKTPYQKVLNHQTSNDLAYGIQSIVNRKLFSGTYNLIENGHPFEQVTLTDDGKIIGWHGYETYYVMTDFAAPGPENDPSDAVCFDLETHDKQCFSFKFSSDTLVIYRTEINTDSITALVKYQLVKTREVKPSPPAAIRYSCISF